MREALAARSGRDFVAASAPLRRSKGPQGPSLARRLAAGALGGLGGLVRRHPSAVGGGLLVMLAAGGVALNALSFQTARHPAPLFGEATPPKRAEVVPLPPSRPAPVAAPVSAPPASPKAAPAAAPARPGRDPIGDLITRTGSTPDPVRAAAAAEARPPAPEPVRAVLAAQKALIKLNYGPLAADGRAGPATRAAIERFEREKGLPVTGEAAGRTARALAAASGVAIE